MNAIGIALLWCVVQVTFLAFLASGLYLLVRWIRPAAAILIVLTGLLMVALLSLFALSPWPRWAIGVPTQVAQQRLRDSPPAADSSGGESRQAPGDSPRPLGEGQGVRAGVKAENEPTTISKLWQTLIEQLSQPQTASAATVWRWPSVLAAVLLAATLAGLAWLLLGVVAVHRQRLRSRPVADARLRELVDTLRAELGCRRPVEIRQSDELATAATIGWRRPVLLLPADWAAWTDEQRWAVLAHEIAHARSRDFLTLLCGQLALVLHFYHPLMHWLVSRLRLEQELAADAAAASVSGGQRQYLLTIAQLALQQHDHTLLWPARAFFPTRTTFLRRIAMLRDSELCFDRLSPAARGLAVGAVVLCGLLAAGLRGQRGTLQAAAADAGTAAPVGQTINVTVAAPAGIDLTYVPANAIGLVAARPAAILKRPELAEYGKLLGEGAEPFVPWSEVEQATGILLSLPEKPPTADRDVDTLAIYQTTKPNKFDGWLQRMPDIQKKEFEGKTYLFGPSGRYGGGVFRPNDRTFVWASSERALHKFFQAAKGLPKFVDAQKWAQFEADQAVAAVEASAVQRAFKLSPVLPPTILSYAPLWQDTLWGIAGVRAGLEEGTQLNIATGPGGVSIQTGNFNIPDELRLHGTIVVKDEKKAEEVQKTLAALLTLAVNQIKALQAANRPTGEPPHVGIDQGTFQALGVLLAALRVDRQGPEVRIEGKLNMADVQKMLPSITAARNAALKKQAMNNMKQLGLTMHNYHDAQRRFPPAVLYGPIGKTPYSWRVAVLPYLDEKPLYDQYHFDEPWDSPNNRKVLEQMPAVFRSPTAPADSVNASYFALVGPGTMFEGKEGTRIAEVRDGTSHTILLVEAKRDIPWTKPEDIAYDPDKPLPELGGYFPGEFLVGLADGSVRFFSTTADEKLLRALITKAGGEPVRVDDAMVPSR